MGAPKLRRALYHARCAPSFLAATIISLMIVQIPGTVAIFQEMIHEVRIIPLDGRPHVVKNIREWLGDSRVHWRATRWLLRHN